MKQWLHEIERYAAEEVNKLLVGNKLDLEQNRQVSTEDVQEFAQGKDIQWMETSAKENHQVEQAFLNIASQIMQRMNKSGLEPVRGARTAPLKAGVSVGQKKSGCC